MKFKQYVLVVLLVACYAHLAAQTNKPLHEIIFFKMVNNQNAVTKRFVRIDSVGNVYDQNSKVLASFDMRQLTKEISDYIVKEKVEKIEADNNPPPEAMTPKLNQQSIYITVWFKDDVDKERNFMNKTNYAWGEVLEKDKSSYPLYRYLSEKEVSILKELLK